MTMTTQASRTTHRLRVPRQRKLDPQAADPVEAMVLRSVAVVGLVAIALIHLLDVQEKIEEAWLVGWSFVGLIVVSLVLAHVLALVDDARAWLLAGALAAATLAGYAMSRAFGLPTENDGDVGNWTEPLGLASLLCEAVVVWACMIRLTRLPRRS